MIFTAVESYRVRTGEQWSSFGEPFGAFHIPGPCGIRLFTIASSGDEDVQWEHVSVSTRNRCPNWQEMCFIKALFWSDEEVVMQLHPPKSRWINNHPYCLHLWRPVHQAIPLPPDIAVGYRELNISNDPGDTRYPR